MFLDAINSKNLTLAEQFYDDQLAGDFKERFTLKSYLDGFKWIASTTGGLDFYSVRTYDPPRDNLTTVICRDRQYGSWWAIVFHYGDVPEDGIVDLNVVRASMPEAVASDRLSLDGFRAELSSTLDRLCGEGVFAGAVLVASGNDVIFERACGVADSATGLQATMDTRFDLGTMAEMFRAVAVMQLVEKGTLSLNDRLSRFVSGLGPAGARVTVGELLSFSSGVGDSLAAVAADEGTSLADRVIEGATGEDAGEYLRAHVFEPAGMGDTDERRSTAPDLHRFTMALASGALLSGDSVEEMWTDHSSAGTGYGYGFAVRMTPRGLVAGHDAASTGSNSSFAIYVRTGHTVVVLSDVEGQAWPVDALIRELMIRLR
jgi:CubicO group peptidase (beta-lactamase class C family)